MSRDVPLSLVQPHKGEQIKTFFKFSKIAPFTFPLLFAIRWTLPMVGEREEKGRGIWIAQGEGNDCWEVGVLIVVYFGKLEFLDFFKKLFFF